MRGINYLIAGLLLTAFSSISFAQLDSVYHQGPAAGSLSGGVMVELTTDGPEIPVKEPRIADDIIKFEPNFGPMYIDAEPQVYSDYVYVEDANAVTTETPMGNGGASVLLQKFPAIGMTNSIPPDPHLAAGPNHVIACVNSRFHVWDKQGNLLATRDADVWISPVIGAGAFDPQIIYDHYEGRWFMLWDWQNNSSQQAYFIISVSDDDDPMGTWYTYLMDAKVNGTSSSGTWGDYPQLGFDEEAIYIMSRSFTFSGFYQYNRIRILDKAELYAANGGPLTWVDIWNIRQPGGSPGLQALDVIHPVVSYTPGSGAWFVWANRSGANFYAVYKILNPLSSSPRIRGKVIPVTFYGQTPNANQLGGGTPLIEANGSHVKTQPVLRDGLIYTAHSIRNTTNSLYASAKYFIFDINTNLVTEEAELGAVGFYYIYPTITVDQDHNIAVTYSRSADTEYVGAYYSTKQVADPPGLSPSQVIQEGLGNYVVTFGGSRNRWGDYLGIFLDPDNFYDVWMLSEYVASTNQWGTYIAQVRMAPFPGVRAFVNPETVDFGDVEIGTTSDIFTSLIANYGTDDLVISDLPASVGDFTLVTSVTLPYTLSSYDSLLLEFTFTPTVPGDVTETYTITNNDPNFTGLTLQANGYNMFPALDKTFYASSGNFNNGETATIDKITGSGTNIGPSGFTDIKDIAINEDDGTIYACRSNSLQSEILRVNAGQGDAYLLYTLDLPEMETIAFDNIGVLYAGLKNGEIYTIDLSTGSYTSVITADIQLQAIAINPIDNTLWATVRNIIATEKDRVYTINLATGDTTRVGNTGFGVTTVSIAFDEAGNLFGIKGSGVQVSDFFSIDVSNGTGTIIGSTGLQGLTGIGFAETGVTSVEEEENNNVIPSEFSLAQNYPNPFNPTTSIEFSLPVNADVQLVIYNILGQQVATLLNEQVSAGTHSVVWNATDASGTKLTSGVYLYKLQANGSDGSSFQQIRKMVLLK